MIEGTEDFVKIELHRHRVAIADALREIRLIKDRLAHLERCVVVPGVSK